VPNFCHKNLSQVSFELDSTSDYIDKLLGGIGCSLPYIFLKEYLCMKDAKCNLKDPLSIELGRIVCLHQIAYSEDIKQL